MEHFTSSSTSVASSSRSPLYLGFWFFFTVLLVFATIACRTNFFLRDRLVNTGAMYFLWAIYLGVTAWLIVTGIRQSDFWERFLFSFHPPEQQDDHDPEFGKRKYRHPRR